MNASAPGKAILFGEHAVVYGRPALAVPVLEVSAAVEVRAGARRGIWIDAPEVGLQAEWSALPGEHPLGSAVRMVLDLPGVTRPEALEISIRSTIPVASGLGSGAAVSVALIRALAMHLGRTLTVDQVSGLAFQVETLHHGTPSGIDNTVIAHSKPVFFVKDRPIEILNVGSPFTLVIGDTGVPAPTRESVGAVRILWERERGRIERTFDEIAEISQAARLAIERGRMDSQGALMDANHALLQALTVSSPELDRLVDAARRAGALGAKMSGGGRGGNMIALAEAARAPEVRQALTAAGARRTIVTEVR